MKALAIFLFVVSTLCGSDVVWTAPTTLSSSDLDTSSSPQVVMDTNGNATAIWVEGAYIKASNMPSGGTWSAAVVISGANATNPCLAVDANGVVTALWIENGVAAVTAYANGWNKIPTYLSASGASSPALAIDGDRNIIAAWLRAGNIETATKLAGQAWPASPQVITAPGAVYPKVALGGTSAAGTSTAIVTWHVIQNPTYDLVYAIAAKTGASWGAPAVISNVNTNGGYAVPGIDQSGNGVVLWYAYDIYQDRGAFVNLAVTSALLPYNGIWQAPTTVSSGGMRDPQSLSIQINFDPVGNAIAAWTSSSDGATLDLYSSILVPNSEWMGPSSLAYSMSNMTFGLAVDTFGNSYVSWMVFDPSSLNFVIQTAGVYVNAAYKEQWTNYDTISMGAFNGFPAIAFCYLPANANPLNAPANSLAAVWASYDGTSNVVQAATGLAPVVTPPTSLQVTQASTDYHLFTQYTNTLTWQPSQSPGVVYYLIFRNGFLISGVYPGTTKYVDVNQHQQGPVTYGICALNSQRMQSSIVTVKFPSTAEERARP